MGNSGGFVVIRHNDKSYKIHELTDAIRKRYVLWMRQYVVDENEKLRSLYSPKAFREIRADLAEDLRNGKYAFGAEGYQEVVETIEGSKALVRVMLNDDSITDDELDDLIEKKGKEIGRAIKQANGVELDESDKDPTAETEAPDPKA